MIDVGHFFMHILEPAANETAGIQPELNTNFLSFL
jgi:hypothetical protein